MRHTRRRKNYTQGNTRRNLCHHASSRAIAAKAFRARFYWFTAVQDAKDIVRTCEASQRFATKLGAPAAKLNPIPLAWPFAQWGLNMVGKLHKSSPGGHVFLLVALDKFTKWIEAMPVTTQDGASAVNFIQSIVFRFGVPNSIITIMELILLPMILRNTARRCESR